MNFSFSFHIFREHSFNLHLLRNLLKETSKHKDLFSLKREKNNCIIELRKQSTLDVITGYTYFLNLKLEKDFFIRKNF